MSELLPLRVLILEDKPSDAELMVDELRQSGFEPEWWRVDNEADYLTRLDPAPEIILADYRLPQWDAPSALRALQKLGLDVPFIMISGTVGEDLAVECIKQGAADYLLKDRLARLGQAVERALELKKLRDQQRQAEEIVRLRARLQKVMGELGVLALQGGDLLALMNAAVASVASALEVDYCSILELQADGQTLLLRAGVGWNAGRVGQAALTLEPDSLAAYSLQAHQPVVVQDFPNGDAPFSAPGLLREHGVVSGMSVTIYGYQQPIGVLGVFAAQQRTFTAEDTYLLRGVADLLTMSIERKRAEHKNLELAAIVQSSQDGIFSTDLKGNITSWNKGAEELFGYSEGEVIGASVSILVPMGRAEEVPQVLEALGLRKRIDNFETECQRKSGQIFPVSLTISPIPDTTGRPVAIATIVHDITERKRAEMALAHEHSLLRAVIDNLPDSIYAKDAEGRYLLRNETWLRLMGVKSLDEVVGKTDFDYFPQEMAERYTADDQQVIQSGQPLANHEETTIDSVGSIHWLLTTKVPLVDDRNNVTGLVGISRDITNAREAEAELRKLHRAVEQSASTVVITDLQGNIEYVNPYFTHVTGYTAEEVIGKNPRILKSGETPREVYTQMWATLLADGEWRGEFHNRKKSGELFWESASISAIKDSNGQITHFLAVKEDITERKRTEEALHFQARLLDTVVEAVIATQSDGKVVYWNRFAETLYGWSAEEAIGRNIVDLTPADTSREQAVEIMARMQSGESWTGEFTVRSRDGATFPALVMDTPIVNEQGEQVGIIGVSMDISERKRAEAAIRELNADLERRVDDRTAQLSHSRERTEAILNSSSDVIILCRTDATIEQANRAFDVNFGSGVERFGHTLSSLAISEHVPVVDQTFGTVVETRQPQRLEINLRRRDSDLFAADMVLSPVSGQDGALSGVVCVLRDITERKQMEDNLRKALANEKELNELKMRFVSMVSHDFRTPLSVIRASSEMLDAYYDRMDEDGRAKHFSKINSQISRMIDLLNDVLTISRADAGKIPFSPVLLDLDQFCRELTDEFQSAPTMKPTLVYSFSGEPMKVPVDEKLLQQALINLLTNAFKYSPEGGTVHFDLSLDEDNAVIRVRDSGIGIPETDLPHLFETFHRASNVGQIQGTGLGLAIVKRSIEVHGGTISCVSQVGVGTTFTISLPRML